MTDPGSGLGGGGFRSLSAMPWEFQYLSAPTSAVLTTNSPGTNIWRLFTVPTGVIWELLYVRVRIQTAIVGGNRVFGPRIANGGPNATETFVGYSGYVHGPGAALFAYCNAGWGNLTTGNQAVNFPSWPIKTVVPPNFDVQIVGDGSYFDQDIVDTCTAAVKVYRADVKVGLL